MNTAEKFALCQHIAARIVAAYRAAVPSGCDPQNTGATLAIVGGVAAIAGAGVGAYGASQAGKGSGRSRSIGELGSLPYEQQLELAREYADEQLQLNRAQADLALAYGPRFAQQQRADTQQLARDILRLYPQFAGAERRETSKSRAADLGDFSRNAPGWGTALRGVSPAYGAIDEEVRAGAGSPLLDFLNIEAIMAGPTPIRSELETQAYGDLLLRGALSPEEERAAQQSARAAWSDRGLAYSNPAVATEVLQRDAMARAREAERRQFAQQVWGIGSNEDQMARQLRLNVQAQNEAATGNYRNFLLGGSQAQVNPILAASMQRSATQPMNLLGMYGIGSRGVEVAGGIIGPPPSIAQGVQALTPLYEYGADVYGTNFNAAEARALNKANAYSAIGGGLLSTAGTVGGAAIKAR